jgi:hypothetical protein
MEPHVSQMYAFEGYSPGYSKHFFPGAVLKKSEKMFPDTPYFDKVSFLIERL